MAGIDLTTVKELMGHKDIKMTLGYAYLAPRDKVKAEDVLNDTLNKKEKFTDTHKGNEPCLSVVSH
jgi:site-specific recombinase XerD